MDITGTWIWRIQAQMMSLKTSKIKFDWETFLKLCFSNSNGGTTFQRFQEVSFFCMACWPSTILWNFVETKCFFSLPQTSKELATKRMSETAGRVVRISQSSSSPNVKALCVNSKEQRLQLGHGFGIPLSVELNMYVWFIHNYNLIMCYSKAILVHVIFRNFTF